MLSASVFSVELLQQDPTLTDSFNPRSPYLHFFLSSFLPLPPPSPLFCFFVSFLPFCCFLLLLLLVFILFIGCVWGGISVCRNPLPLPRTSLHQSLLACLSQSFFLPLSFCLQKKFQTSGYGLVLFSLCLSVSSPPPPPPAFFLFLFFFPVFRKCSRLLEMVFSDSVSVCLSSPPPPPPR